MVRYSLCCFSAHPLLQVPLNVGQVRYAYLLLRMRLLLQDL